MATEVRREASERRATKRARVLACCLLLGSGQEHRLCAEPTKAHAAAPAPRQAGWASARFDRRSCDARRGEVDGAAVWRGGRGTRPLLALEQRAPARAHPRARASSPEIRPRLIGARGANDGARSSRSDRASGAARARLARPREARAKGADAIPPPPLSPPLAGRRAALATAANRRRLAVGGPPIVSSRVCRSSSHHLPLFNTRTTLTRRPLLPPPKKKNIRRRRLQRRRR